MRLFVAVWPPAGVLEVLASMERPDVEGVRWTTREQWHVTLRFLGEVESFEPVAEALAGATFAPAHCVLGDATERFGRAVLHVPVTGLETWASEVVRATAPFGSHPPEDRPFSGHVTLARARDRRRGPGVRPLAGVPLPPGPRAWVAEQVGLVRSRLGRSGAQYETVATVPA